MRVALVLVSLLTLTSPFRRKRLQYVSAPLHQDLR